MTINPWKLSTLVLAGALALTLSTVAFGGPTETTDDEVTVTCTVDADSIEASQNGPQPHMKAALASLRTARNQLKKATANKGGHRVKAIAFTQKAINQTKLGIAHANKK